MIAFLDLEALHAPLIDELKAAAAAVIASGRYVGGPAVAAFEQGFARQVEAAFCVGCNSGLDALRLALMALDIGPGDEVIVPAHTFIATWLAVDAVGARPVPVDPAPGSFLIDAAGVEAAITPRTKAIMPVHLYGEPVNLSALIALARTRGLHVIEDAAQAHGAVYDGKRIGGHSLVCWSFYPGKNLGALGDGGAVTCDDPALMARIARLANYGSSRKYRHDEKGINSRLDPVQAAMLSVKLPHLDGWVARRRAIARAYRGGIEGVTLPDAAIDASAWHLFVVRHDRRDALQARLKEARIETLIHYPSAPHQQPAYADAGWPAFPRSERLANEVLSLPMGPHLDDADVDRVIDAVNAAVRALR